MRQRIPDTSHDSSTDHYELESTHDKEVSHFEKRTASQHHLSSDHIMLSPGGGDEGFSADRLLPLLGEKDFYTPRHEKSRGQVLGQLQRRFGNRWVQGFFSRKNSDGSSALPLNTRGEGGPSGDATEGVERVIQQSKGLGHPMDEKTGLEMESAFGRDLSHVRLHTDSTAEQAARSLGAEAFTTDWDIYFSAGRYEPETKSGRRLLAHELAHTIQQSESPQKLQTELTIGSPDCALEREADEVAEEVVERRKKPNTALQGRGINKLQLQEEAPEETSPPPPTPVEGGPAETAPAPAEPQDFVIKLGRGITLKAEELEGTGRVTVDLSKKPPNVPGVSLKALRYYPRTKKGEVEGDLNIPFASAVKGGVKVTVDKDGSTELKGRARLPVKIGAINDPTLELTLDETRNLSAELAVTANKLKPRGLPKLSVEGGGTIHLKSGRLGGEVKASLVYKGLGKGDFHVGFKDGVPEGAGKLEITQEYLKGVAADLQVKEGDIKADVAIPASKIAPPIPGLEVPEGTIHLIVHNRELSGSIEGLHLRYKEFGEGILSGTINRDHLAGEGSFTLVIPAMEPVKGNLGYRGGNLFGRVTLSHDKFPKSLPVRSGSITAGIDEKGSVDFKGKVGVDFHGVGRGELRAAYEEGKLGLGADVTLNVPGLQSIAAKVDYIDGKLEGEVDVPIESKRLAGIGGNLHVEYRDERWKAEQQIEYNRDDGKVKGTINLGLLQDEKGKLAIYGGGDVTAQLTSFLQGQLKVDVLPEGTTKLHGAIVVTEPLELFPEKKADKELFNISKNIPLWAILVAVIRLRGGVRAGVGPGQLRDITVEGEYTIGEETQPSFVIQGELFIPAYAEAYLAFGVGLGLDVLLGSLTGGIEAIGTAGVYGAVSVMPEIAYRDGNYSISGEATLAAAAKIKLGLQAWAEIEALWITVWEKTWHLAEWVWDVGPTLALQAKMEYVFGQPVPPTFEFKTSDIDAERLIQDAMPKEGPKGSGAREAMKNRAEWKGRTKAKGKEADKVPAETAAKETKAPAPKAPPKPPKKAKPTAKDKPPTRPVKEKGGKRKPELEKTIEKAAEKELKDKEKEKKTLDKVPSFPKPTDAELDVNWANYLETAKGKRIDRAAFEKKMHGGEVFHPGLGHWRKLKEDYVKEYPRMSKDEADPTVFARQMRGGYMVASPAKKDPKFDNAMKPPPEADGINKPYPIHWPNEFLVSKFKSVEVGGNYKIPATPRDKHTVNIHGEKVTHELGVASEYGTKRMAANGEPLQRQDPGRTPSKTAAEWRKWDRLDFQGQTSQQIPPAPHKHYDEDSGLFMRKSLPKGRPFYGDSSAPLTFGTWIDEGILDKDAEYYNAVVEYRNTATWRSELRAAARAGKINIGDINEVRDYVAWLEEKRKVERSERGHLGYEMQHVIPLFLIGASADRSENMWPLTVDQHRTGHSILKKQPHLKTIYKLATDNLESTDKDIMGKLFQIKKHGSSL